MDYRLEYGLRLHTAPKYKILYSWAINEVDADGCLIGEEQIPCVQTLHFSATSCVVTNRLEITAQFSPPRIESDQIIRITLRPTNSARHSYFVDDVTFTMFGTKRAIRDFTLEVRPLDNSAQTEQCTAWGSLAPPAHISYRDEIDRPIETVDRICFSLFVKLETFECYVALIDQGAIDTIFFSVGSVAGLYCRWSPSISTNKVKVLLSSADHKLDLPPDFQGEPPRLGRVRDARLLLLRRLELSDDSPSSPALDERADPTPPASSALRVTSEMDPRLLPVLASLKQAAWVAVALLTAIALLMHWRL